MRIEGLTAKASLAVMTLMTAVACNNQMKVEVIEEPSGNVALTVDDELNDDLGTSNPGGAVNPAGKAMMTGEQMLQSMISLAGLTNISAAVNTVYMDRAGSLPVGRDLNLITAPMWISATNISGSVCNELVVAETAKAAASRQFFNSVDFTKGNAQLTDTVMTDIVGRLARSFWSRSPSAEELASLNMFKTEFFSASDVTAANAALPANTSRFAIGLCSAMLSSFDILTY